MGDDVASRLTDEQMADLCALADGTLPADRRPAVEAWVADSSERQQLLDRQRRSLAATRVAASEPMPASLGATVQPELAAPHGRRFRRLVPRVAFAGAAAAVAAVTLVVALGGEAAEPTVADAAGLADQPPTGPAPPRLQGSRTELAADVDGVQFPDYRRAYGWRADGVRHDTVDGRDATVVYYRMGERRVAYVIVSGSGLPLPSDAGGTVRRGVEYQTLLADGQPAVTWRRVGHTCVLTGSASRDELLNLASWQGGGALDY
jgi:anti-sigma factor RsiW